VANTLCKALEGRGFSCWIASRNIAPGENFQIAIVRAIRSAKIMLLVFTGNSNNSDEMAKELALASQSKLIVVPLLIDDVRPNDAFSYEFATRQWIDFFSDWETAIEQLAHRISVALATEAPAAQPAAVEASPPMPAPTPDVIAKAFADQPAAAAAPIGETLSGLAPAAPASSGQAAADQTLADTAGKTAVLSAADVAAASPAAAALAAGPSSFQDAPTKRGAPVVLIVTLSLLLIVMIAGAAVILPSFLAKKPSPPTASATTNTVTALTTTPAPPPTPPLVTQPSTATPGPAPMASETPPAPTAETPVQPTAGGGGAAEDPDLDPETHHAGGRYARHHGGGGSSGGGGSADVPF
jgi:hypothetical protein